MRIIFLIFTYTILLIEVKGYTYNIAQLSLLGHLESLKKKISTSWFLRKHGGRSFFSGR